MIEQYSVIGDGFGGVGEIGYFCEDKNSTQMKFLKRLFYSYPATPEETVVPDDLVEQYPDPPEKLQVVLQKVPNTGIVLYQYKRRSSISKSWKYWALDMMENGFGTPGIVQLAGEDLNMNPFQFANLAESIFQELDIDIPDEVAYYSYAVCIANEVLRGERTARNGFELLSQAEIDTDYSDAFRAFYIWLDKADEIAYYDVGGGMRPDNIGEWMYQYFEKLVQANKKYCPIPTS